MILPIRHTVGDRPLNVDPRRWAGRDRPADNLSKAPAFRAGVGPDVQ